MNVNESVQGFVQTTVTQVRRNGESYDQCQRFVEQELESALTQYRALDRVNMTARLLRDKMDWLLRRYQNYCIREQFGGHYREVGVSKKDCDFEHVLPESVVRDLLIHQRITIAQAMNSPTCMLSRRNHRELNSTVLGRTTPDIVQFWQRYQSLGVEIETHRGDAVDLETWTLADHYSYFGIQDQ